MDDVCIRFYVATNDISYIIVTVPRATAFKYIASAISFMQTSSMLRDQALPGNRTKRVGRRDSNSSQIHIQRLSVATDVLFESVPAGIDKTTYSWIPTTFSMVRDYMEVPRCGCTSAFCAELTGDVCIRLPKNCTCRPGSEGSSPDMSLLIQSCVIRVGLIFQIVSPPTSRGPNVHSVENISNGRCTTRRNAMLRSC